MPRWRKRNWTCRSVKDYTLLEIVGRGTFGEVWRAKDARTDKDVALKMVKMEREHEGFPITALREMKILSALRHPNIVQMIEIVMGGDARPEPPPASSGGAAGGGHGATSAKAQAAKEGRGAVAGSGSGASKQQQAVSMVLEYLEYDLAGLLEAPDVKLSEAHIKSFLGQLLAGTAYMHDKKVLHRDLKCANLLIGQDNCLKVADWGLAREFSRHRESYTCRVITLWYRPPELLMRTCKYDFAVDLWSVGCIFAEMLEGQPMLQGKDEKHQLKLIFSLRGTPNEHNWPLVAEMPDWPQWELSCRERPKPCTLHTRFKDHSPEARDLLSRLLELDPARRITAEKALQHPYFAGGCDPPHLLPRFNAGSCHEYEAKQARDKRRKLMKTGTAAGGSGSSTGLGSSSQSAAPSSSQLGNSKVLEELLGGSGGVGGSGAAASGHHHAAPRPSTLQMLPVPLPPRGGMAHPHPPPAHLGPGRGAYLQGVAPPPPPPQQQQQQQGQPQGHPHHAMHHTHHPPPHHPPPHHHTQQPAHHHPNHHHHHHQHQHQHQHQQPQYIRPQLQQHRHHQQQLHQQHQQPRGLAPPPHQPPPPRPPPGMQQRHLPPQPPPFGQPPPSSHRNGGGPRG